jgi:hypothetical protein
MPQVFAGFNNMSRASPMRVVMFLIVFGPGATMAAAIQFEVPNGLLTAEGNGESRLPFGYASPARYQQVYDASQFSRLPAGGAFLTRIFMRVDCSNTWEWLVTNLQVNISTTLKKPDSLSAVFAENVGTDETLVFGPINYITPGPISPSCPNPQTFATGQEINVDMPFYYDPALGNLLLDLRHLGNNWRFGNNPPDPPIDSQKLDAQTILGDSVSRVAAFSVTTNTAEIVDTTGLVTAFQFDPIPSLWVRYETNTLVVTFPLYPTAFVLQWSDILGPAAGWQKYPGQIEQIGFFRMANIPGSSLSNPKYFRLFLNTPQRIPAGEVNTSGEMNSTRKP